MSDGVLKIGDRTVHVLSVGAAIGECSDAIQSLVQTSGDTVDKSMLAPLVQTLQRLADQIRPAT